MSKRKHNRTNEPTCKECGRSLHYPLHNSCVCRHCGAYKGSMRDRINEAVKRLKK